MEVQLDQIIPFSIKVEELFNHNDGKVTIDPDLSGCTTRTVTMTVTATSWPQFYDFEVNVNNTSCNEDVLSITSGDTIVVLNDFTHIDGYINNGVIQCEGHLFLENGADGGTGVLFVTGTEHVAFSNTSTSRFPKIVIDKSGGSVSPAPGTNDLYCQAFTLIDGDFTAPTGYIYILAEHGAQMLLCYRIPAERLTIIMEKFVWIQIFQVAQLEQRQ